MKTVSVTIFTQKKNKVATEAITAIRKKFPRKLAQCVFAPENENEYVLTIKVDDDRPTLVMNLIESIILPCNNNTAIFCESDSINLPTFGYYPIVYVKVFGYAKFLYLKHQ